jgi:acetyltransferase-like isoleucine patch superfamily enzyme
MSRFWWAVRDELRSFATWFVLAVPGRIGDGLRLRWMRRRLKRVGENVVFRTGVLITMPENVSIGSNCNFAPHVVITGGGGVTIGDWVGFGPDVKVWSMNHRFDDPDRPWLLQGWETKPVTVEDDVWLGANVFVMPGVTIGKGAIVSAGSVVNKAIPPFAIVVGNPGRVVGWRKQPVSAADTPAPSATATREAATASSARPTLVRNDE